MLAAVRGFGSGDGSSVCVPGETWACRHFAPTSLFLLVLGSRPHSKQHLDAAVSCKEPPYVSSCRVIERLIWKPIFPIAKAQGGLAMCLRGLGRNDYTVACATAGQYLRFGPFPLRAGCMSR